MSENQVREVYGVGHVTIDDYAYYHTLSTEDQANLEKICVIDSSPDYIGAYYRPDGSDGLEWGMLVKADFTFRIWLQIFSTTRGLWYLEYT